MKFSPRSPSSTRRRLRGLRAHGLALAATLLLGGCVTNGDFDRVRPSLVREEMHDWVGRDAVASAGGAASEFRLTDEERQLRDLAYALIEPPYDRNRWYSVWQEYGLTRALPRENPPFNRAAYWYRLNETYRSSEASAYAQITTDARNDVTRLDAFFMVALRVTDMDQKRAKSLSHVTQLSQAEHENAIRRNHENAAIVAWVCRSLHERAAGYRFALERLVIATPSASAVDVERSLTLLHARAGQYCRGAPRNVVQAAG